MAKIYNFGAGPACLPQEVLMRIREDIPNWREGMSIMEMSHRAPAVQDHLFQIEKDLRTLLAVPEDFCILFMHGGARTQFSVIPLNLLGEAKTADYLVTGFWSKMAYQDALRYCSAHCVASTEEANYTFIPDPKTWTYSQGGAYFHYTDNESINGVEFFSPPSVEGRWLVSDMTSSLLSKPIDFSPYGLIYASTQKNLGIAGLAVVIVRRSLLGVAHPLTPHTLNYDVCESMHSLSNTPPVFCWYVTGLVIEWVRAQGGIKAFAQRSAQKAKQMYEVIDSSDFYTNPVAQSCRSQITIPFHLPTPLLDTLFVEEASKQGLKQLKGHKLVGGCRACLYNALPMEAVSVLTDFMREFERTHG